ncbi:MAG: enoyl-CoA hydratase-related protein [Cytophagales bacterium]|nr:enoyl-CoA hydratase-related protein [Cytophagales bacterium]
MKILTEQQENLRIIKLNRPDVFNSLDREMSHDLIKALKDAQENDSVRAVMLTAHGKAFCAGQDLQEVISDEFIGIERTVAEHYNEIVNGIRNLTKPVVAAVNGVAAGAGANIAFVCDVVVAHEAATFMQAFSKIGLIPDSGGTFTLPRLIGWQKASALMMLGDKVSAEEAERMGMIYKVLSADEFEAESLKIATKLSNMPTKGLAYTKHLLSQSFSNDFDQQLEQEKVFQAKSASTEDYQEGINAFLEKRKPNFTGK